MKIKAIFITFAGLFLIICGGPGFEIIKITDLEEVDKIVGQNNRLSSKSSQGGTHVDSKGVYLDPYIIKEKSSEKILEVGFYITHQNFDLAGGFRPIREIVFLTEKNEHIVSKVSGQDSDYDAASWNVTETEYNTTFTEYGICRFQLANFIKILTAKILNVKIIGESREQTYSDDEISPSFRSHLTEFYNTQLK